MKWHDLPGLVVGLRAIHVPDAGRLDLAVVLKDRYGETDPAVRPYFERLADLSGSG